MAVLHYDDIYSTASAPWTAGTLIHSICNTLYYDAYRWTYFLPKIPKHWRWYDPFREAKPVQVLKDQTERVLSMIRRLLMVSRLERRRLKRRRYLQFIHT